jgi:uncharacterized protein (DUF1501 family)
LSNSNPIEGGTNAQQHNIWRICFHENISAITCLHDPFGDALRQTAFGATAGGNVLVVISLRGGVDGLGMVVPHGDPGYYRLRPRIAVNAAGLVAKDPFFGLHPSMKPLAWLYESGELAAVHAVGM